MCVFIYSLTVPVAAAVTGEGVVVVVVVDAVVVVDGSITIY